MWLRLVLGALLASASAFSPAARRLPRRLVFASAAERVDDSYFFSRKASLGEIGASSEVAAAARDALGDAWLAGWWAAPSCWDTPAGVFFSHIAWLHTVVQAWGLHQFARDRCATLERSGRTGSRG